MPKLKSHKATVKRIKLSGSGKLLRNRAAKSHLLTHKTDRIKTKASVSLADQKRVKRLAPYLN